MLWRNYNEEALPILKSAGRRRGLRGQDEETMKAVYTVIRTEIGADRSHYIQQTESQRKSISMGELRRKSLIR